MEKLIKLKYNYRLLKSLDQYQNIGRPNSLKDCVFNIIKKSIATKYTASLDMMMKRVNSEPKLPMIYSGIKKNSVGIIVGPSKSGKTMFCENLAMCIASGESHYLDLPIDIQNRKVLIISFEEFYTTRTERNILQAKRLVEKYGDAWLKQYIVANEKMPSYLETKDWKILEDLINDVQPGIVFLDSLTHMYNGTIEDSETAKGVMQKIRELSEKTKTTIVVIHHTTKMYDKPLTMDSIAGSRVIAQECDFMIGLNKTPDGHHYVKDVAFRYIPCNDEHVKTYKIDEDCWLNVTGEADEMRLLTALDGRRDEGNKELILDFITEQAESGSTVVPFKMISEEFVKPKVMSSQAAHDNLNKLVKENKIIKVAKGEYKKAA